jgi:predicted translin family RNA/ssDNA-binding protein
MNRIGTSLRSFQALVDEKQHSLEHAEFWSKFPESLEDSVKEKAKAGMSSISDIVRRQEEKNLEVISVTNRSMQEVHATVEEVLQNTKDVSRQCGDIVSGAANRARDELHVTINAISSSGHETAKCFETLVNGKITGKITEEVDVILRDLQKDSTLAVKRFTNHVDDTVDRLHAGTEEAQRQIKEIPRKADESLGQLLTHVSTLTTELKDMGSGLERFLLNFKSFEKSVSGLVYFCKVAGPACVVSALSALGIGVVDIARS